nr:hypothetical protein B0A51_06216 [Rachicladosporium sp. CCFEE 5018]
MAAQWVFEVPELLESILLKLDSWYTPFALLRVSKTLGSSISVMSVAQTVIDLPELLENIIQHDHGWKSLFPLLRVNRYFKATIKASPQLRRKMWLATPDSQIFSTEVPQIGSNNRYLFNSGSFLAFAFVARRTTLASGYSTNAARTKGVAGMACTSKLSTGATSRNSQLPWMRCEVVGPGAGPRVPRRES